MNASSGLISLLVLAILAVIPVALWLLKRTPMGGAGMGGCCGVVSSLPLHQPAHPDCRGRPGRGRQWLVLGATPQSITTLHTCPASGNRRAVRRSALCAAAGAASSPASRIGAPMRTKWLGLGLLLLPAAPGRSQVAGAACHAAAVDRPGAPAAPATRCRSRPCCSSRRWASCLPCC